MLQNARLHHKCLNHSNLTAQHGSNTGHLQGATGETPAAHQKRTVFAVNEPDLGPRTGRQPRASLRQAAAGAAGAFEHDRAGGADLGGAAGGLPQRLGHRAVEGRGYAHLEPASDER